jgi:nucleoside 2-deoxyribosyltransferase
MSDEDSAPVPPENKSGKPRTPERSRIRRRRNRENPATILLQFRDGHATDMGTLFEALGVYEALREESGATFADFSDQRILSRVMRSFTYKTFMCVQQLIGAGLLQADDPTDDELEKTKIHVTPLLRKIQDGLDLSLTFLATMDPYRSMNVEPLFGKPHALIDKLVFVLMPFKADMLPVYEDHIKPTCASLGLTVQRGDDFFTAHSVIEDIWKAMVSARLIVADCTDRNPNVFYEIGLAHTLGKPTILLTQQSEDVPFDLRHLRYIAYQLTPRGMREFETKFKETVQNVLFDEE